MKFLKKIAIHWYRLFDASGQLYTALKSISLKFRLLAYVGLFVFTYASLVGVKHIFNDQLEISLLFDLPFGVAPFGILLCVALIPTYETIYRENMTLVMAERKTRQKQITTQKLQWWRLRNINIYVRIALYLLVSMIMIFIVQVYSFLAFFESYPHPTEEQMTQFYNDYYFILGYITTFYFVLIFFTEYRIFLLKERRKK